jgi:hypothetical protein
LVRRDFKAVTVVAAIIVLMPSLVFYPWQSVKRGEPVIDGRFLHASSQRQAEYRRLAQALGPDLPAGTVILMPEIGELGFYLPEATVLDACGLVSPEALPHLPVPAHLRPGPRVGVVPPDMVRVHQPDLLILMEVFGRRGILEDEWFQKHYSAVIVERGDWLPWNSEALYVFARNDFGAGQALATRE